MKKFITFIAFILASFTVLAQESVEMADVLRSSGKIYVVVAIMVLLFLILMIYLFLIDRRLKKIEKY